MCGNVSEMTELCIASIKKSYFSAQTRLVMQRLRLRCCAVFAQLFIYRFSNISDSIIIKRTVVEERLQHLLPVKVGHQTYSRVKAGFLNISTQYESPFHRGAP